MDTPSGTKGVLSFCLVTSGLLRNGQSVFLLGLGKRWNTLRWRAITASPLSRKLLKKKSQFSAGTLPFSRTVRPLRRRHGLKLAREL
jgi:hypothetical protein